MFVVPIRLAPNAKLRSAVVAYGRPTQPSAEQPREVAQGLAATEPEVADTCAETAAPGHDDEGRSPQPSAAPPRTANARAAGPASTPKKPEPKRRNYPWAELTRRSFGCDVLTCVGCGGRLKLLDVVTHPGAIRAILTSLGLPTEPPVRPACRAPPDDYADCA